MMPKEGHGLLQAWDLAGAMCARLLALAGQKASGSGCCRERPQAADKPHTWT